MNQTGDESILPEMKNLGRKIRAVRDSLRMSQGEFSQALGVTAGAVSNWERGGGLSRTNAERIAEIGHTSLDWLLSPGDGPPPIVEPAISAPTSSSGIDLEWLRLMLVRTFEIPRPDPLSRSQAEVLVAAILQAAGNPPFREGHSPSQDQLEGAVSVLSALFAPKSGR